MKFDLLVRPAAQADLQEIQSWYRAQCAGLDIDFLAAFQASLETLGAHPEIGSPVFETIKALVMKRFPYRIFYVFDLDCVEVLAVFHMHRDPKVFVKRFSHG